MTRPYTRRDVLERFMSKVEITDSCWNWTAGMNPLGYGQFSPGPGLKAYAHRWVYATVVEPIPRELQIDHLCRNPSCVNPDHLEPVTPQENMRRGKWATRTHCINGHEWTEPNTYRRLDKGSRMCRACAAARARQRVRDRLANSTDLRKGCPGDPASNANKPQPTNDTEFLNL